MKLEKVIEHELSDVDSWICATAICKARFLELTDNVSFLPDEVQSYWRWFCRGWQACRPETFSTNRVNDNDTQ